MATGVQNAWSATPASNATADSAINWREGQAPSSVNDSVRAMMALIRKWYTDWRGSLVTGGTSTAYTLTTAETLTLADGVSVTCRMSATNGATPTLNMDSTGAVAIQSVQGTAIAEGTLLSGGIYTFVYYAASAAWIVKDAVPAASATAAGKVELATVAEAGTGTDTARAVTPAGLFPAAADVASASTTNIGAAASSKVRITGTTTITAFDTVAAGIYREGYFADALTFTHGAGLLLPGAANITTAANDRFGALSLGSGNWIVLWYQKATGRATIVDTASDTVAGAIEIAVQSEMEAASDAGRAVVPARQHFHPGHLKAWANVAHGTTALTADYGVASVADNGTGDCTLTFDTAFSATGAYGPAGGWARGDGSQEDLYCHVVQAGTKTTTTFQLHARDASGGTLRDSPEMCTSFVGDI